MPIHTGKQRGYNAILSTLWKAEDEFLRVVETHSKTIDNFYYMWYIYYMNTTNEFQTTKIWKKSLRTLKRIAALTDSSIVETVDRLASQEWERVQARERKKMMTWNNNTGRYQATVDSHLIEVDGDAFAESRDDLKKSLMEQHGLSEEEAYEQADNELLDPIQWSGNLPMSGVFIDGVYQGE